MPRLELAVFQTPICILMVDRIHFIGSNVGPIDTLKGMYSFAFGENVGTNGTYSTVFGKNTFGDSAYYDPITPYESISSLRLGEIVELRT